MALTRSWESRIQSALFEALNVGETIGCEKSADIRIVFRSEHARHIRQLAKSMGDEIDAEMLERDWAER